MFVQALRQVSRARGPVEMERLETLYLTEASLDECFLSDGSWCSTYGFLLVPVLHGLNFYVDSRYFAGRVGSLVRPRFMLQSDQKEDVPQNQIPRLSPNPLLGNYTFDT